MKKNLMRILLILTAAFGLVFNAESQRHVKMFPDSLLNEFLEPFTSFAETYVGKILDMNDAERGRRLLFDEVTFSFPLSNSAISRLLEADQISLSLQDGKNYEISWLKNDDAFASMAFPASYNLIRFTDQAESFNRLKETFEAAANKSYNSDYAAIREFDRGNVVQKPGETFHLGYLTTDTYIDAVSKKPVWGPEVPKESLANLFVAEIPVAPVNVKLSMEGYDKEIFTIALPFEALEGVLKADGNLPYFGIAEEAENGDITAVAYYHNPLFAYIHTLEVIFPASQHSADVPTLEIRMLPYIKIHNLKNLWSEKNK